MPIRIAVVGSGYWGKNLVRNFHELGVLGTICDPNPMIEASTREKYPSAGYARDYAEVLADPAITAVVLATPAKTHYSMAAQALQAGKDLFVEKPLAITAAEGAELVELATRRDRILMVGHILQYHPAVIKLKQLIKSGTLGANPVSIFQPSEYGKDPHGRKYSVELCPARYIGHARSAQRRAIRRCMHRGRLSEPWCLGRDPY